MTVSVVIRGTKCGAAGFTLLELLVALAIFAAVIVLALPRLGRAPPPVSLRSTTLQLVADLRATRSAAQRSNVEKSLTIDIDGHSYRSDAQNKPQPIPAGISIELSGAGIETSSSGQKRLRFWPDGRADPGSFLLRFGQQSVVVTIDKLTSSTQIAWVN